MKRFTQWLENRDDIRNLVVGFLQDKLNIRDPEVVMNMNTSDIEPDVMREMMQRGLLRNDDYIQDRIDQGVDVKDLVDLLEKGQI